MTRCYTGDLLRYGHMLGILHYLVERGTQKIRIWRKLLCVPFSFQLLDVQLVTIAQGGF